MLPAAVPVRGAHDDQLVARGQRSGDELDQAPDRAADPAAAGLRRRKQDAHARYDPKG